MDPAYIFPCEVPLTKSQHKRLAILHQKLLLHHGLGERHVHKYEYKQWEVREVYRGKLSLVAEMGRIGDENNASIILREHRHIFIGPRGGLELASARVKSKSRGLFNAVHARSY